MQVLNVCLRLVDICLPATANHPPIFILGAPRSGSTLLIQSITKAIDIGYLSNLHCRYNGSPALVQYLFGASAPLNSGCSFESFHGQTNGFNGPAECGEFWYRYFRRKPAYVTSSEVSERKLKAFQRSVNAFAVSLNKPVIFKNLYASLRIQPIVKAFPNACFIVIERNIIDNAHSILEGRFNSFGCYDKWWSIEPPKIDDLIKLRPHEQVVHQIIETYNLIESDIRIMKVPASRVLRVKYEDFCMNPNRSIEDVRSFLLSNNMKIKKIQSLPSSFVRRTKVNIDFKLYADMKSYYERLSRIQK